MSYRVFGSMGSPYSIKVRSYFRYKDIDHVWLVRNTPELVAEHGRHSKLPLVPTVVSPDGLAMQDSSPIIEQMETKFPEPSIHPTDAKLRFISELLEEFADEWGNKWMMHLRWYSAKSGPDSVAYSRKIAVEMKSGSPVGTPDLEQQLESMAAMFKDRMLDRGFTVGSNEHTAPIIESSYLDSISLLNDHLAVPDRPYIFGCSPSFADFGLSGQLIQMLADVTAGELMRVHAPHVVQWCERMLNPRVVRGGGFESWDCIMPTLMPFLTTQVSMFLGWSDANAKALAAGKTEMKLDLGQGNLWIQTVGGPQKYHAKSLKELRRKYHAVAGDSVLVAALKQSNCWEVLASEAVSKL